MLVVDSISLFVFDAGAAERVCLCVLCCVVLCIYIYEHSAALSIRPLPIGGVSKR